MSIFTYTKNHTDMSAAKVFAIKESEKQIKSMMKTSIPLIAKRLQCLLVFKRNQITGISKRDVADEIGVNHNSIQTWRALYIRGGIQALTSHNKAGFKPSVITKEQEKVLKEQLHKPDNGMVGFKELLAWFNSRCGTDINYKTFHGFVVRKFNAKIKTARKSHIKKDTNKVEAFKKTSHKSVNKSSLKKKSNLKR